MSRSIQIGPALFAGTLPWLKGVDVMNLLSRHLGDLSAVIFDALIIPALVPIALKGVSYRPLGPTRCCARTCWSGVWAA